MDYTITFMANASKLWRDADLDVKQAYQSMIFLVVFQSRFCKKRTLNLKRIEHFNWGCMKQRKNSANCGILYLCKSFMVIPTRIELVLPD